jgi:UDP-3-O-[3-hydroxymyristoyl] N-acetylglucosamine deacetylase/3-hydroxyacyl-[acyl-carrier-protein] dehydratase
MTVKQKTLAKEFSISGKGLHTNCLVNMTFKPAPVNHGFKFQRIDLDDKPIIPAFADFVIDTSRGTVIENKGARLSTIEHSLAALTGMDLDNVLIEIDNEEVPILDGSSRFFVQSIEEAGIVEQDAEREYFVVTEKIVYRNEKTGSEIIALPDHDYSLNVLISFNS